MKKATMTRAREPLTKASVALLLIVASSLIGSFFPALAAQQGPFYATEEGTMNQWKEDSDAKKAPDNKCAYENASNNSTDLVRFSFTIPPTATINGITVEPKYAGQKDTATVRTQLLKAGIPTGTTKSLARPNSAASSCSSSVFVTLGSSSDLWGTTWTPTDINNASFGVRFTTLAPGDANAYIDAVRITVNYTDGGDIMTVTITAGNSLSASVGRVDIESGKIEFLGQTTLKVVSTAKNWCVRATASVISFPTGADNPGPNAIEFKNTAGVFTSGGTLGGVIVMTGSPTSSSGLSFTVDLRVKLSLFGDGKIGSYQFTDTYTILENVGTNCS